ncbi:pyridoxal-phosphate dependent enzyme [Nocardioides convexus]|uniref:pyridoxal-phosphate dependent enzyme n=1 Tax=Nocardioides convexus TaxID=2712224 RepID=UPI002418B94B|nr:pyridoxal-phosphate dependent enzyme [Nocardioides convexus]
MSSTVPDPTYDDVVRAAALVAREPAADPAAVPPAARRRGRHDGARQARARAADGILQGPRRGAPGRDPHRRRAPSRPGHLLDRQPRPVRRVRRPVGRRARHDRDAGERPRGEAGRGRGARCGRARPRRHAGGGRRGGPRAGGELGCVVHLPHRPADRAGPRHGVPRSVRAGRLGAVYVPVGSGTGAAGACLVRDVLAPDCQVIGVQSAAAPAGWRSWRSGAIETAPAATRASGLATTTGYPLPQRILRGRLDDFVLVLDDAIDAAARLLATRAHTLAEGAGAAALAGLLTPRARAGRGGPPGRSRSCAPARTPPRTRSRGSRPPDAARRAPWDACDW